MLDQMIMKPVSLGFLFKQTIISLKISILNVSCEIKSIRDLNQSVATHVYSGNKSYLHDTPYF